MKHQTHQRAKKIYSTILFYYFYLRLMRIKVNGSLQTPSSSLNTSRKCGYMTFKFGGYRANVRRVTFAGLRQFFSSRQQFLSISICVLEIKIGTCYIICYSLNILIIFLIFKIVLLSLSLFIIHSFGAVISSFILIIYIQNFTKMLSFTCF